MSQLKFTPVPVIEQIHRTLYKTFRAGTCRPVAYRRHQLLQLARMTQENADAFANAIHKDLAKPKQEVFLAEVGAVIERAVKSAEAVEEWVKPDTLSVPDWQKPWNPTIYKNPKGPVLIIAPWNYPMILSLQPLIAAMSAGCPAVVKPSEISPAYSQLLAELAPKYLDSNAYRIVNGAITESTKLLELRWAHIFYTGNGRVGRIIASAAARHLTPVSLELGGKSPVIIDPEYDIKLAAKRVLFGKIQNAGQLCVSPDYVLITKNKVEEFVEALKDAYNSFFPEGALASNSLARMVSPIHYMRVKSILDKTKGKVVIGGNVDGDRRIEPTVVVDVKAGDSLMEDEIFGPILPIVAVNSIEEAIDFINSRDHPLAFYAFTERPSVKEQLIENTLTGSLIFNDTFMQLAVNEMPFSGVGESGYGYQVMKYGFDGFTHQRSSMDMPAAAEPHLKLRYPPYTEESLKAMSASVHMPIPKD